VISDERVTSTDDPRSDVVFDLVFDIAWPISAALPPSTNDRASTAADASGEVVARGIKRRIWPLVLLRQRRDLIPAAVTSADATRNYAQALQGTDGTRR